METSTQTCGCKKFDSKKIIPYQWRLGLGLGANWALLDQLR